MTIADQITRINNAKAAIKNSIENKGVTVSSTAKLDEYAALIDSIEVGSGGNENDWLNIKTNNGRNYGYFFYFCNAESLDVSNFDTSKATDISYMFYCCTGLRTLDLSNFNTSNVTKMSNMFYMCNNLTSIDVSSFNTSQVTDMNYVFYSCKNLTSLDVSNFNTSQAINISYMFSTCEKLESLDVSNFDTSKATNISGMFEGCKSLTELDVSSFDTSKVTNMAYAFQNCNKLTSLDLSNWDISKVTASYAISNAFNCPALTDFKAPKNINAPFDFSKCPNLTHDSLMSIINNLATVTKTTKLTLGATNLAKLNDEEIAIAVNRGWTLA